jgi:hypothetical protein
MQCQVITSGNSLVSFELHSFIIPYCFSAGQTTFHFKLKPVNFRFFTLNELLVFELDCRPNLSVQAIYLQVKETPEHHAAGSQNIARGLAAVCQAQFLLNRYQLIAINMFILDMYALVLQSDGILLVLILLFNGTESEASRSARLPLLHGIPVFIL